MSWWSDRWRSACLDQFASSNPQVDPGVALASKGRASIVHVEPGQIRADIRDRRDLHVVIGVQQLDPSALDTLAVALANKPMLCASVLTGELPADVDGFLIDAGMSLLPAKGEVLADCECDEYHRPCRHGVAALLGFGDLVGADPFALLLARGIGRDQLVARLREIRGLNQTGPQSDEPRGADPGTAAAAAFRRTPSPVTPVGLAPRAAVYPATLLPSPPLDSGLSAAELQALVFDASQRAVQLLRAEGDGSLRAPVEADLARRAAAVIEAGTSLAPLSEVAGVDEVELSEQARCWVVGGAAALAIRTARWTPAAEALGAAQRLFDPPGRASNNVVSSGDIQLRLDEDGNWWRFVAHQTRGWVLDSGGFARAGDALDDQL